MLYYVYLLYFAGISRLPILSYPRLKMAQIAESCFDAMYFEMVKYIHNQSDVNALVSSGKLI
jgi:hypothetical protein